MGETSAATVAEAGDGAKPATATLPLAGGVIAGIAASVCCVGPVVLVLAGVSGAWIGSLEAFTPYRWIPIAVAALFFGLAARRLFFAPKACAPGSACADPRSLRGQRVVFVVALVVVCALVAFPWYAVWFL